MPRRHSASKHTPFALSAPCARKKSYSNEHEAQKAAEEGSLRSPEVELATYKCPYCGKWHLRSVKLDAS